MMDTPGNKIYGRAVEGMTSAIQGIPDAKQLGRRLEIQSAISGSSLRRDVDLADTSDGERGLAC